MTRKTVSFEEVLHWTEFNVKIHCEIDVKLVFHAILWNKHFTVYPSLKNTFFTEHVWTTAVSTYCLNWGRIECNFKIRLDANFFKSVSGWKYYAF